MNIASKQPTADKWGFRLVQYSVVIAIVGVLCGMLLPSVQWLREGAPRRTQPTNNLRQHDSAINNDGPELKLLPLGEDQEESGVPGSAHRQGGRSEAINY